MSAYRNHWLIRIINELATEQGYTPAKISDACGISPTPIREIMRGQYLPKIETAECILRLFGYELDAVLSPEAPPKEALAEFKDCPFCGNRDGFVRVHGHVQCRKCNSVVERCCDE